MPEKTKPEDKAGEEKKSEKTFAETETTDTNARCEKEPAKSYYYDDAHGYEIYRPGEDDDDEEDAD